MGWLVILGKYKRSSCCENLLVEDSLLQGLKMTEKVDVSTSSTHESTAGNRRRINWIKSWLSKFSFFFNGGIVGWRLRNDHFSGLFGTLKQRILYHDSSRTILAETCCFLLLQEEKNIFIMRKNIVGRFFTTFVFWGKEKNKTRSLRLIFERKRLPPTSYYPVVQE